MAAPHATELLAFREVRAAYGHSAALHGLSFSVVHGEIVGLLGSNGAGKSTALRAVSNLLPAQRGMMTRGDILYEGKSIRGKTPAQLVRMGIVPVLEGRRCFASLTVEENLLCGGFGPALPRRETRHDLERVYALFPRLKSKRKTLAGFTSGGEQQMTAIGRGLMARPKLFVLDEPSMGLAPLIVEEIFTALKRLNKLEGLSILVAEQNSAVALQCADRATVVEHGVNVLEGRADELRARDDIQRFYLGGA
ncbi:branched-chain amino acid transport system ATP-binding protein [Paraburkholderia atlantica]|uniref:ABC transporter ATP-binding protein n=1 Tax=Paraburkholderia atlantica TaxID=2654982 RepID=UPI00128E26A3|nr:ABC transporter ATP-binding protein [Paraburkholderia atlantica]MPW08215.1 ATP-binding cassette domain-containing protein [Paraburkholderia atlantica]